MATAIWTTFAVAAMVAIFAACVAAVSIGLRLYEQMRAKRRG
jgi:hypothetical protein